MEALETLRRAREIGKNQGVHHIYLGNVAEGSDTFCHNCNRLLIKRSYFNVEKSFLKDSGCPYCGTRISGLWH